MPENLPANAVSQTHLNELVRRSHDFALDYRTLKVSGRLTRGPNRKCSGGKLLSQRVRFIRSSFDWAVCSEPLARSRRTRAYGYSIAECVVVGSDRVEVWPKCTLELRSKESIV